MNDDMKDRSDELEQEITDDREAYNFDATQFLDDDEEYIDDDEVVTQCPICGGELNNNDLCDTCDYCDFCGDELTNGDCLNCGMGDGLDDLEWPDDNDDEPRRMRRDEGF